MNHSEPLLLTQMGEKYTILIRVSWGVNKFTHVKYGKDSRNFSASNLRSGNLCGNNDKTVKKYIYIRLYIEIMFMVRES